MQFLAQDTSAMADIPTMVLHPYHIAYMVETNGIEMTGDRFFEINLTRIIGFFDKAVAPAIMVGSSKDTVFVVDDGCDLFARWIEIG